MKLARKSLFAATAFFLSIGSPGAAQDALTDDWQFAGSLYLWGAGIDGSTTLGTDMSVSFSDIVENLDFAIMGTLEAERGNWAFVADLVYLDVSAGQASSRPVLPGLPGGGFTIDGSTSVELKGSVVQLLGGYRLTETENTDLHATFGARYLDVDTSLGLELTGPSGQRSTTVRQSASKLDGVIGLKGRTALSETWFTPYYFDVGAGQSKLTWQAFAGIGYDFGRSEVVLGYRHLAWEFDDLQLLTDLAFSGPALQFRYKF